MTKIPNFNPREIVANIRRMIEGEDPKQMKPWYKGFQGEIAEISGQKYACNGEVSIQHNGTDIEITELPVGTWTQTYKESVIELYSNGTDKFPALINDYKEYHTDTTVKFVVSMKEDQFRKHKIEGFHKFFKLQSAINLTSMVLFDRMGCLKRYADYDFNL
jgi:DNA topoisomerase-2